MIVEPAPTNPRSPLRRGLRLAGLTVPLFLLVGIVAAGVLGPRPAPDRPPDSSAIAAGVADSSPGATERPALVVGGSQVDFPVSWIGLRVRSVADTLTARAAGAADAILAVAGYLSYRSVPWTCGDAYVDADRTACGGQLLLADVRSVPTPSGVGPGSIGPHLHPVLLPSTRAPAPNPDPNSPRSEPIPVVVLGRFLEPPLTPCPPGQTRDCGLGFAIERVVWVAGAPWGPTLTVDPEMQVEPNIPEIDRTVAAAADALGVGSLPLATSVVRPGLLSVVDPVAAAALPPIAADHRLRAVTYARRLVFQFDASQPLYGRDPQIGWVVLDSITEEVLARGGPKSQPLVTGDGAGVGLAGQSTE
jgi:hypothetical protein